jgi:hypothetical protein
MPQLKVWNGSYWAYVSGSVGTTDYPLSKQSIDFGDTLTIPVGFSYVVGERFTVNGTLIEDGDLVIAGSPIYTGVPPITITGTAISINAATSDLSGSVELATIAETTSGSDTTRAVTPDGLAGSNYGKRVACIKVISETTTLTTGSPMAIMTVPVEINGWNLVTAHASVYTVATSGSTTVMIRNVTSGSDMLTVGIKVPQGLYSSYTVSGSAGAIDTNEDDVATGDRIAVDVDVVGAGTKGLDVMLTFQLP